MKSQVCVIQSKSDVSTCAASLSSACFSFTPDFFTAAVTLSGFSVSRPFALEHGEQRHLQRPAHHGVEALLPSGPLQQADDRRPAHVSVGHDHREQDRRAYWHFHRTPPAGVQHEQHK